MREILRAENLTKTFTLSAKQRRLEKTKEKTKTAVSNLSFSAYEGEIFGLLGPNGAGKTTTLRILAALIKADSGDAYIDNLSVTHSAEKIRSKIGFLTSDLKLEEFFTPSYLFDFFSELHSVDSAVSRARKTALFERFGISGFANEKIENLSTGMKQKASLVISVVHNPDFIIFDEPTNGLDVITAKTVTDYLLELKEEGKSIIISTHIFSLVEKICSRVGIIINGEMSAVGTLEEVREGSSLEDVFFDLYYERAGNNI